MSNVDMFCESSINLSTINVSTYQRKTNTTCQRPRRPTAEGKEDSFKQLQNKSHPPCNCKDTKKKCTTFLNFLLHSYIYHFYFKGANKKILDEDIDSIETSTIIYSNISPEQKNKSHSFLCVLISLLHIKALLHPNVMALSMKIPLCQNINNIYYEDKWKGTL